MEFPAFWEVLRPELMENLATPDNAEVTIQMHLNYATQGESGQVPAHLGRNPDLECQGWVDTATLIPAVLVTNGN